MSPMDDRQVLTALKEEAELCGHLAELREEQRTLIDAGEAECLLDVLARKQRTLDRIGQLEAELKPLRSEWDQRKHDFRATQRVAIGEAFREVRCLLEDLIAKENSDAEALAARKGAAAAEMETFGRRRQIHAAYGAAGRATESRLIDRKDA